MGYGLWASDVRDEGRSPKLCGYFLRRLRLAIVRRDAGKISMMFECMCRMCHNVSTPMAAAAAPASAGELASFRG